MITIDEPMSLEEMWQKMASDDDYDRLAQCYGGRLPPVYVTYTLRTATYTQMSSNRFDYFPAQDMIESEIPSLDRFMFR